MIKGIVLGICLSVIIVSLIIIFTGLSGALQPNLLTGAVIGQSKVMNFSMVSLLISFVVGLLTFLSIIKKN